MDKNDLRTLQDLVDIAEELNPTGGFDKDWNPIPRGYVIDFFRDIAFIVLFDEEHPEQNVIDHAIYLQRVGEGLYIIYKIDGKILGELTPHNLSLRLSLINSMKNKEVFKK